jgi:hypothetical protein
MTRTTTQSNGSKVTRRLLGVTLLAALSWMGAEGAMAADGSGAEPGLTVQAASGLPDAPSAALVASPLVMSFGGEFRASSEHLFLSSPSVKRLQSFEDRVNTPDAFANVFVSAIEAQLQHAWPGYGRGLAGFQKRLGAVMLERDASSFFGTFLFPSLFHQDTHYFRMGPGTSVWHRAMYAMSRTVLTRTDAGGSAFNSSLWLSVVATASVKNLYYPQAERGFGMTMLRTRDALIGSVQDNLTREFLPDVEAFFWKHAPGCLKRLERRMPLRKVWEPAALAEEAGF